MKRFKIESVVNGTTIKVSPRWKWELGTEIIYGDLVKVNGYNVENPDHESLAVAILETLLAPKENDLIELNKIGLRGPTHVNPKTGTIHCSVYLNDVDVSEYFGAFKADSPK